VKVRQVFRFPVLGNSRLIRGRENGIDLLGALTPGGGRRWKRKGRPYPGLLSRHP
jgi:hypothetical protein